MIPKLFLSVTDLILNSFQLKWVKKSVCDKFKETGQFCLKDIENIEKRLKSDSIPLPKLIKLLEYLSIIAAIKPENSSPQSDVQQEVYFMPAVLRHAEENELQVKQSRTDPVPIMIRFKYGFVPVGVFCAAIASLIGQKYTCGWILQEPKDGHILCKNMVTFRIDGAYDVTFVSKPKHYEVHIARISTPDRALEEICQQVLETVCDTLDQVISKMKDKQTWNPSSKQTLYELGFKCPKHSSDDHLVINRLKCGEPPSQCAKSVWFNYLEKSIMICTLEGKSIDLKLFPFAQQSLVWFGEVSLP